MTGNSAHLVQIVFRFKTQRALLNFLQFAKQEMSTYSTLSLRKFNRKLPRLTFAEVNQAIAMLHVYQPDFREKLPNQLFSRLGIPSKFQEISQDLAAFIMFD